MGTMEIVLISLLGVAIVAVLAFIIVKGIKNHWFSELWTTLVAAIKEAEASGKEGAEKKAYVLQKIEEQCDKLGIPYKLLKGLIGKLIDEIVKHHNIFEK